AFLRGVIAQFDAFAAIKGEDADSRAVRAEGRFRVGTMRYRLGEIQEAEQDYNQAVSIYKQLAADFPSTRQFRQTLATSHTSRAIPSPPPCRLQDAEEYLGQAIGMQQDFAAISPAGSEFRGVRAGSQNNRGRLLYTMGRMKDAEQDYDQAVSIYEQLTTD